MFLSLLYLGSAQVFDLKCGLARNGIKTIECLLKKYGVELRSICIKLRDSTKEAHVVSYCFLLNQKLQEDTCCWKATSDPARTCSSQDKNQ